MPGLIRKLATKEFFIGHFWLGVEFVAGNSNNLEEPAVDHEEWIGGRIHSGGTNIATWDIQSEVATGFIGEEDYAVGCLVDGGLSKQVSWQDDEAKQASE